MKNSNELQRQAFEAIAQCLPTPLNPGAVTVEDGLSYTISPIKAHDYATGLFAAFGAAVEQLGRMRGLPEQSVTVNRRLSGLVLNSLQLTFVNGRTLTIDDYSTSADNGTYRTRDGRFVTLIGLHPKLREGIFGHFGTVTAAGMQHAIGQRDGQELEDTLATLRLPLGLVRSPEEWLAHRQGAATAAHPMILFEQHAGGGSRKLAPAKARPLEGVRVVELANVVAGPTCARALAEQGAEVIKIAPPTGPITTGIWLDANWGKRQFRLDITSAPGRAKLVALLADADVLLSSQSPGVLSDLNLNPDELFEINPDLIVADFSYAPKGSPWAFRKGFEQIAQAVSGIVHAHSENRFEDSPTLISVLINDFCSAYNMATGIVAALTARQESGGGWYVEHSLLRNATEAVRYIRPVHDETYAPVSEDDLLRWAIDQDSPLGVFTRLCPPVMFSHTPSCVYRPTMLPFWGVEGLAWQAEPLAHDGLPHRPSEVVSQGRLLDFVSTYGIEDRGDGGGRVSFYSRSLFALAARTAADHG